MTEDNKAELNQLAEEKLDGVIGGSNPWSKAFACKNCGAMIQSPDETTCWNCGKNPRVKS